MIVDASVAYKWIVDESLSDEAELLVTKAMLRAPDVMLAEVGHAVTKRVRRGEILVAGLAEGLSRIPKIVALETSSVDVSAALDWAVRLNHSFYDCLYLAMAERCEETLITADAVFVRKVATTYAASRVLLLERAD